MKGISIPFIFLFLSHPIYAALSATTVKTIQGTAPKFAPTVDLNNFKYFGLRLKGSNNDYYDVATIGDKLKAELVAQHGVVLNNLTLTQLFKQDGSALYQLELSPLTTVDPLDVIDDDGDGDPTVTLVNTGGTPNILGWYYKDAFGTEYKIKDADLEKSICGLSSMYVMPYLKVSQPINLNTKYGDPHTTVYDGTSGTNIPKQIFPISSSFGGALCGVKPDMSYSRLKYEGLSGKFSGGTTGGDGVYMGETDGLGFLPQSLAADNFPTTGANGLFFSLIVSGVDATKLKWTPNFTGTANGGINLANSGVSSTRATFKLTGPIVSGATVTKPYGTAFNPNNAKFTIEGKDSSNTTIISYSFELKKWYINRQEISSGLSTKTNQAQAITWCNNYNTHGYRSPKIADLTNAKPNSASDWLTPAIPSSGNYYQRIVGGGLFSEWGDMQSYNGAYFWLNNYWSNEAPATGSGYVVGIAGGSVGHNISTSQTICVSN